MYLVNRDIRETNILPKGYCCKDVTEQFALSKVGLKLNKRDKEGLAYTGRYPCIVSCGTLRELLIKIREQQYKLYTILALDRVYKELYYLKLQNIR